MLLVGNCHRCAHIRRNLDEAFLRRSQRVELGVRQATGRTALGIARGDRQDAFRGVGGHSPQANGVDDCEEGRIHPDAKPERQHGDSSEARRASQLPAGMTDVALHVLQPRERARVAMQILRERCAPHRAARSQARLFRRHAALLVAGLEHRHVRRHLAVELVLSVVTSEQRETSVKEASHRLPCPYMKHLHV